MKHLQKPPFCDYAAYSVASIVCAFALTIFSSNTHLPIVGIDLILPATVFAVLVGMLLIVILQRSEIHPSKPNSTGLHDLFLLLGLGALLAVPPILIDLTLGFPRDINAPLPVALIFYPAIGLVAEVVFHLLPLTLLVLLFGRRSKVKWLLVPVIFVEPVFQAALSERLDLRATLIFANVSLISAAQLWLFSRFGFGAMMGLRLSFYLFWHVLWGAARLPLLF